MAVWEVRAVFAVGDRHWENVWHVDVGDLDDVPSAVIEGIKDFHIAQLLSIYTLERIVRRPAGSHDAFIETVYDLAGVVLLSGAFPLPLFDTMKIMLAGGVGRPGLKFLRGLLKTDDIVDDENTIASAKRAAVQASFDALLTTVIGAACNLVFGADKAVSSSTIQSVVQMRQPHRKRRRSLP